MKVKAFKCLSCGDIIYSRSSGDFRQCSCTLIYLEGGGQYLKYDSVPGAELEVVEIEINETMDDLYKDWESMKDDFGIIRGKES